MKKVIKLTFVAAFVAVAGYSVYVFQSDTISDLALANVEALAQGESGGNVYCCGNYGTCMLILGGGEVKGIKSSFPCP